MASLLRILSFLSLFTPGVLSQIQMVQSGPGVLKPGETLTLTCAVTGESITTSSTYWEWILQSQSAGLKWMGQISFLGDTTYNSALQSRFSMSRDTAKNQFSLELRSLTAADTATYYCAKCTVTQSRREAAQKGEAGLKQTAVSNAPLRRESDCKNKSQRTKAWRNPYPASRRKWSPFPKYCLCQRTSWSC
ncbi:hypothetical protein Y1Q_0020549 [Alligator mississippiensis]|uniref:Ig-like domain-containing protein n=1 Tax=Alligator mississippiensis TaxID=8496 RepID=A0A151NGE3_ALLMI|nr:hypothetical protein Y1Q_0020549 [Alligator mississippiensis]